MAFAENVSSLFFLCGNRLSANMKGGKDVLHDFIKRRNVNWRGWRLHAAKRFYAKHELGKKSIRAAFFVDTNKRRRGKKVSGVSSHYDHTPGKTITGRQVPETGPASSEGYAPLDSQIYIGTKKVQEGSETGKDKRCYVGRDYATARKKDKNQMLRQILKRVVKAAISFTHVIADSWF